MYANSTEKVLLKYLATNPKSNDLRNIITRIKNNQKNNELYTFLRINMKQTSPQFWNDVAYLKENRLINVKKEKKRIFAFVTPLGYHVSNIFTLSSQSSKILSKTNDSSKKLSRKIDNGKKITDFI